MDISNCRREYTQKGLRHDELNSNPFLQFEAWYRQAEAAQLSFPNAMSLATAGENKMPTIRTVLLKTFDDSGFVFYTNYGSDKAKQLTENPQAGLLFHWLELERQVKISGQVEKVSAAESLKYFATRPRGRQLGAWSSDQSQVITSRSFLEAQWQKMKKRFADDEIPIPG